MDDYAMYMVPGKKPRRHVEIERVRTQNGEYVLPMVSGGSIRLGIAEIETNPRKGTNIDDVVSEIRRLSDCDIVVGPEYAFLPEGGPLTEQQRLDYSSMMKEDTRGGNILLPGTFVWRSQDIMYNTCYAFSDNMTVFSYNKRKDGGDSDIARTYGLRTHKGDTPGDLRWKGMSLGVEICADAGTLSRNGKHDLDIGVLISCGNLDIDKTMRSVRVGGYGIIADGWNDFYGVFRRTQ